MKVSHYMSCKVITSHPEAGIRETFFLMREHRIRHIPVVDGEGRLLGIISDRDLRRPDWVDEAPDITHLYNLDDNLSVQDLMSRNLVSVHTHDSIHKAVKLFREHRYGALPVLNKDDKLVGIISAIDLLAAFEEVLKDMRDAGIKK